MKQHRLLITASAFAVLLAFFIIFRSISSKQHFDNAVRESLKTSEGYDQRFIDMVNRLEELLATRAQFGYSGGKDPMTGTRRQVVLPKAATAPVRTAYHPTQQRTQGTTQAETAPAQASDQMRLTAIIADATGKKITAIIMDGERSYSVEKGDMVGGRKISHITNEGIYMETDTMMYFYDIYGNVVKKSKETGNVSSVLKEEPPKQETPDKLQGVPNVPKQKPKPRKLTPITKRK